MSGGKTTESVQSIYQEHHRWLNSWLQRRLGNEFDAADLAHDTFVRLIAKNAIPAFASPGEIRAYLSTIAGNLCINLWQRREVERAWQETLAALPENHYPSAERQAMIMQALNEIASMLQKLPPKVSKAFLLAEVCQMTDAEVAAEMQVSERSVRNYVAQAMLACLRLRARDAATDLRQTSA